MAGFGGTKYLRNFGVVGYMARNIYMVTGCVYAVLSITKQDLRKG